jgi:predicted O-methyltransferase YrrM
VPDHSDMRATEPGDADALRQENARLRADLANVLGSASWRITRPLRRMRGSDRPETLPPAVQHLPRVESIGPALPDHGVPVRFVAGHYYSPLPDPAELIVEPRRSQIWSTPPRETPGVDWRAHAQAALCRDLFAKQTRLELREAASDDPTEYFAQNSQYPPLDAWALEAMLRRRPPRRMIEIGSGFSSLVTARVNRELCDDSIRFTCIEPYPRQFLLDGVPGITDLIVAKVQDVPLEAFDALGDGDILFVDTSHTVKTGGDVTWIFHEIIPRLAPGVLVHVHDAFLPGDYPEPWVREGWGWNEAYLLHSFLAFNSDFEIELGIRYMATSSPDALTEAFPGWLATPNQAGAALWFRRRSRSQS